MIVRILDPGSRMLDPGIHHSVVRKPHSPAVAILVDIVLIFQGNRQTYQAGWPFHPVPFSRPKPWAAVLNSRKMRLLNSAAQCWLLVEHRSHV